MGRGLVLLVTVMLTVHAGWAEKDDEEVYEPEVEPSDLERHQFMTHSTEGTQFDFVREEANEQAKEHGGGIGSEAPGGGHALLQMMKQLAEAMSAQQQKAKLQSKTRSKANTAKRKPKTNPLPQIAVGTPVSEVLRQIRLSLEAADPEPSAATAEATGASADADEDQGNEEDEEDEDDPLAFIDHLDARGLRLLESDLERQLRRVRRRQSRLAAAAQAPLAGAPAARKAASRAQQAAAGRATPAPPAGSATAATGDDDATGAATRAAPESRRQLSLEQALAAALSGSGFASLDRALKGRRTDDSSDSSDSSDNDDGDGGGGGGDDDETARYEARLAHEAEANRRAARGDDDDDDNEEEEGSVFMQAIPLHEALAKMFGGEADGNVVQMQIEVVGGGEDGEAGRPVEVTFGQGGNLAELLAKATSGMAKRQTSSSSESGGDEDDDSDEPS